MFGKFRIAPWLAPTAAVVLLAAFHPRTTSADDAPTTAPSASASITVTVVGSDSKPAADVRVTLSPAAETSDGSRPKPVAKGMTDSDGKATLSNVADGQYNVMASVKSPPQVGRGKVTIADGKDASVDITLKPRKGKKASSDTPPTTNPSNQ